MKGNAKGGPVTLGSTGLNSTGKYWAKQRGWRMEDGLAAQATAKGCGGTPVEFMLSWSKPFVAYLCAWQHDQLRDTLVRE